jgi:hypothetical protein
MEVVHQLRAVLGASLATLFFGLLLSSAATDQIERWRARLTREEDAAERAKITVQLGEELLREAGRMYRDGAYTDGDLLLAQYLKAIRRAFDDLRESGRDARRKPKGFKDLEIHLRRSQRTLDDMLRTLPFDNRTAAEETKKQAEEIRVELLGQLMRVDLNRNAAGKEEKP